VNWWRTIREPAVAVVLVAAPPLLSRVAPDLLTTTRAHTIAHGACFAAMALSLNVVAGHAGQLTLGHGAIVSAGALTSGVMTAKYHQPFLVGVAAAVVVTGVVSLVVVLPALRLRAIALGAATLGLSLVVESAVFRWDWLTGGDEGIVLPRPLVGTFRFSASADYASVAFALAALVWVVDRRVAASRVGRAMHAVREDEKYAAALGVDVPMTKVHAFVLAGITAGVAGAAYGHLLITVGPTTFGYSTLSLPLFALVIVAGQGSRGAVAAVAFGYAVMPRVLRFLDEWSQVVGGVLFLHAIVRNPDGIAGTVRRLKQQRAALPAAPPPTFSAGGPALDRRPDDTPMLRVKNLEVELGGAEILRGLSLAVPPRTITALIGPNGSGKTTTLDAISGFLPVRSGGVEIFGRDVTGLSVRRRAAAGLARTFQSGGLPGRLSVEEILLLAQHNHEAEPWIVDLLGFPVARRAEARMRTRAAAAAAGLGFAGRLSVDVADLSVGQQRLVELMAAVLTDAPLVLLDEPSAGLAPGAVDALASQLRGMRDDLGRSVVLVEHNLALVRAVADHVYVLGEGCVVHEGPVAELADEGDVLRAWLGGAAA
jgi:branched-chain amino acid transport system permease protein